jgi:hypothetical protein
VNQEKASELLDAQKLADADKRRSARVRRLGGERGKAARMLAEERWFGLGREPSRTSASRLDRLDPVDRVVVFSTISPGLGPQLERMWQAGTALPYQLGIGRKSFRAIHHPEISLVARHARLIHLLDAIRAYEPDETWIARWAPYVSGGYHADSVGSFLASVIDSGGPVGEEVFGILVASAEGEDEIGAMGRHVSRALLTAGRPDGWAFIERMLLAAQRQEGLRQVILESIDEAHPEAFRRVLRLILDNDLVRFPATVRAIDVWFGFAWGATGGRSLNELLSLVVRLLDDAAMRDAALRSGSGADAYLALWCIAFEDGPAAVPQAEALLAASDVERRYVAAHLLAQLGLSSAVEAITPALDDDDLRVAARALDALLAGHRLMVDGAPPDTFERLERLLARMTKPTETLDPIVWPWTGRTIDRQTVAGALVTYLGSRDPAQLIPHLAGMDSVSRGVVARTLARTKRPGPEVRRALLGLAGDPAAQVRSAVIDAVRSMRVDDAEALELEALLRRKAGDLRRAIVSLLIARGPEPALLSADRLLASADAQQRLAGLEILRQIVAAGKVVAVARDRARTYLAGAGDASVLTEAERTQMAAILGEPKPGTDPDSSAAPSEPLPAVPTIVDGFGLLDPAGRTIPSRLRFHDVGYTSDAAFELVAALEALVHAHRGDTIQIETWTGPEEKALGEVTFGFPAPPGASRPRSVHVAPVPRDPAAIAADLARAREQLPLHDVWIGWLAARGSALHDADGLELLRAHFVPFAAAPGARPSPSDAWTKAVDGILGRGRSPIVVRYPNVVSTVLGWLVVLHPPPGGASFLLDAVEDLLLSIPAGTPVDGDHANWRNITAGWRDEGSPWLVTLRAARMMRRLRPDRWTADDHARLWRLERWVDEGGRSDLGPAGSAAEVFGASAPRPDERGLVGNLVDKFRKGRIVLTALARPSRKPPPIEELVAAFRTGAASADDVIDQLIGLGSNPKGVFHSGFRGIATLGTRTSPSFAAGDESLAAIVERIRIRIVEVELRRGEAPTEASSAALALPYSGGLDPLLRLLRALGSEPFVRGWSYDGESRHVVFSRLIRSTMPGPNDEPRAFAEAVREARVPERRLVELGCFAPQWADHVEGALAWPGLASAIWWMHAHTKDPSWVVGSEVRETWTASVAERTPLDAADLVEGAVDVAWFTEVHDQLGPSRWKLLDAAAKYASTGGGHKRAQLYADAMRGTASEASILARIHEKRHQDSARALGLVPLPDEPGRDAAVLSRYGALQEFIRTSRQFGSSRQASEKRAAEIGLQNLARTAGYADPIRLGWAMEARGVADLADGPLSATVGDVEVALAIDERGEPDVVIRRGGVAQKSIPADAKRSKEISALRARATDLRRQSSRMRRSLEGAMVRGDVFTGAELIELSDHPLLAPQLRRLVLIGEGIAGYPIAGGQALLDHSGGEHAVGASELVRIAHPVDLLAAGSESWHSWQRDAFRREVVQPFKQVFRELYSPTMQELADGNLSRRYAGHQVGPRQALALLGGRGWVSKPDEGVRRTFHDIRLSAELWFLEPFFSPADVEGLTLEAVRFTRSTGDREPLLIADVPSRVFSEVMRDLDLVVSVAHAGGVDPEASASTVDMRATLVAETSRLLDLANVRLDPPRAVIEGSLAEYSVHLGSAVVHRRPGGALFIIPIHSQQRGRVFLPFADDDPKTAEVLAKVLLLARDDQIRDPSILDQIRHG